MGNIIGSFAEGLATSIGKLFGHPLDFLAGTTCSSACGSTWDFICYIENFCIAHLLKLAMVSALFYIVMIFLYLLYKLGICECIIHTLCRVLWACFTTFFSTCEFCCNFLCYKIPRFKQKHRRRCKRDIEQLYASNSEEEEEGPSFADHNHRSSLSRRRPRLRSSMRPRSLQIRLGISKDSIYLKKRKNQLNRGVNRIFSKISKTSERGSVCRRRRRRRKMNV